MNPWLRWTFALALATPLRAAEFHVAPDGDDLADGSQASPFRTLERARDAARAVQPRQAVTLRIAPGIHLRDRTFTLSREDSGSPGAPVAYRGVPGGRSRICGGRIVPATALRPATDPAMLARLSPDVRTRVRVIDLASLGLTNAIPEWPVKFRGYAGWPELFVGGRRMTLARWPDAGFARIEKVLDPGSKPRFAEKPDRPGRFTYSGNRPSRWPADAVVYLKGYWSVQWADEVIRAAGIDRATRTVTLAAPHAYGIGGASGNLYCALNLPEELDAPGEYHIDRAAGRIYFLPPAAPGNGEIMVTALEGPLVRMVEVSHVAIEHLVFEGSRKSALDLREGEGVRIAGCTVRAVPDTAIVVRGGRNHGVQSCDLYALGAGGIQLQGGDRASLNPCGHFADNNHIRHFAELAHTYQCAIRLDGVGCRASHNLIHDTPHEPMTFSGNDHVVEFNEVHDVCLDADDSGAIHMGRDWTWRGNAIRNNFFHHINSGSVHNNSAVYLDDMMCGTEVTGNVIYRVPRGHLVGGGRDNILENNIMVDCLVPVAIDNRAMGWAGYHVGTTMKDLLDKMPVRQAPWSVRYPRLAGIWEDEPAVPKGNVFRKNLMVRCGAPQFAAEVVRDGTIAENLETGDDPGFADLRRMDFNLRGDAAALRKMPGFRPVPFDRIGLRTDAYRSALPPRRPVLHPAPHTFVEDVEIAIDLPRGASGTIRYTLDGREPGPSSPRYDKPLRLSRTTTVRARVFPDSGPDVACAAAASGIYTAMRLGPGAGIWLSDLPAADTLAHGGLKRDLNYAGKGPLCLQGTPLEKGLLMCPEATEAGGHGHATWDLPGNLRRATRFSAVIGIDAAVTAGSVTFVVEVFRGGTWVPLHDSGILRPGDVRQVSVDIAGAERLRLSTTDAGDGIGADHAVWGAAKLQ